MTVLDLASYVSGRRPTEVDPTLPIFAIGILAANDDGKLLHTAVVVNALSKPRAEREARGYVRERYPTFTEIHLVAITVVLKS